MIKLVKKLFSYQPIRFLFVGGLNTMVGYGLYALFLYIGVNYLIANTLSTIIGIFHSYFWNRYFTFKSKNKAFKEITKFVSVYAVSYLICTCTLFIFKDKLNINAYVAGLLNIVINTLISYFGHKYISFRDGSKEGNMSIFKKIRDVWNDTSKIHKIEIVFLGLIILVCYFLFQHADLLATSTHGRALLDLTLKGKFFSFYDVTKSTAVYLIPIYIFFMIWSIPVEIVYAILGKDLWDIFDFSGMGYICMMWYKLLPTLFTIGTAVVLYKIGKLLSISEQKRKWMIFVFMGFPVLVFSQFVFGQYDSINMFFTTLAIYFFLQKKYYKFSLMMAIAIPIKLFPVFIYLPLLLLVEKKVFNLAKHCLIGFSGYAISNLLFITSPAFKEASKFSGSMMPRFFENAIPTPFGVISIFILALAITCVFCYIKKIKDDKELQYYTLYVILFVYSIFFTFVLWHPQWVILLVPVWVLTMFSFDHIKTSMIISIFLCMGYILIITGCFYNNVDINLLDFGLLPQLTGKYIGMQYSLSDLYTVSRAYDVSIFMTIFGSCTISNLILKFPTEKRLNDYKKGYEDKDYVPDRGYIYGLILTICLFILPALYMYFR